MAWWAELSGATGAAIFTALSVVHIYWAVGGSFGAGATVPRSATSGIARRPPPAATLTVAAALAAAALVMLGQSGLLVPTAPEWMGTTFKIGALVITMVFAARAIGDLRYFGFFKRHRTGRFARWDTLLYSPLCVLISGLALAAALTG